MTEHEAGKGDEMQARDIGDLENDEHFVRLLATGGQVVTDSSAFMGAAQLDAALVSSALAGETRLTSVRVLGETFRVVTAPVRTDGEVVGVLQVVMSREEIDEALRALVFTLLTCGPVVLTVGTSSLPLPRTMELQFASHSRQPQRTRIERC